jgi:hypothetical protein
MKRSLFRWLLVSAILGLVVPIALLLIGALIGSNAKLGTKFDYPLDRLTRVIWPSSFWLMATTGIEGTPRDYLFVSISILANIVLYSAAGCVLWGLKDIISATTAH